MYGQYNQSSSSLYESQYYHQQQPVPPSHDDYNSINVQSSLPAKFAASSASSLENYLQTFETELYNIQPTQQCIESVSQFLMSMDEHFISALVEKWFLTIKNGQQKVLLSLLYLCNHVSQLSNPWNHAFSIVLPDSVAIALNRNPSLLEHIKKLMNVWQTSKVFPESVLRQMHELINSPQVETHSSTKELYILHEKCLLLLQRLNKLETILPQQENFSQIQASYNDQWEKGILLYQNLVDLHVKLSGKIDEAILTLKEQISVPLLMITEARELQKVEMSRIMNDE